MDKFLVKKGPKVDNALNPTRPAPMPSPESESNTDTSYDSEKPQSSSSSSINNKKKRYSKSYKQKYRKQWEKEFDFLRQKDGKSFCFICIQYIKGGKTHLTRHAKSEGHIKKKLAAKETPQLDAFAHRNEADNMDRKVRTLEIKLVSFFVEHNVPMKAMEHFIPMLKNAISDSEIVKSLHCSRTKSTGIVVNVLHKEHFSNIVKDLRETKFSLIVDETTDVSISKSLALVVRYARQDCIVKDYFFTLLQVKSSTAEDLFLAIKDILDQNQIPYKNLIGFAADTAAVMMGNVNGLQAKLKELNSDLFVMGCTSHSVHLCSSKACEKLPRTVEEFVRDITNYFANSSKRNMELAKYQEFSETIKHRMLKLSTTRWLSLQNVVDRILEQWEPLNLFFEKEKDSSLALVKAKQIFEALCNPIFEIYLLFLSHILKIMNDLNIEFQSESPKIYYLHTRVAQTLRLILKSFIRQSVLQNSNEVNVNINDPHNYLPIDKVYVGSKAGLKLTTSKILPEEMHNFRLRVLEFYIQLSREIRTRFKLSDDVLKFLSVFDPQMAVSGEVDSIGHISVHFPNLVQDIDIETLDKEWRLLPELPTNLKVDNVSNLWNELPSIRNGLNMPMFPNLVKIFKRISCLPHSSATAD